MNSLQLKHLPGWIVIRYPAVELAIDGGLRVPVVPLDWVEALIAELVGAVQPEGLAHGHHRRHFHRGQLQAVA